MFTNGFQLFKLWHMCEHFCCTCSLVLFLFQYSLFFFFFFFFYIQLLIAMRSRTQLRITCNGFNCRVLVQYLMELQISYMVIEVNVLINVLDGKANLKLFYKNNNSRRLSLTRKFVLAEALSVSACMYKWKTWIKGEFLRSSWKCTITIKKISFILEGKCNSWHNLIFTIGRSFHSRCLYWGKMPSTLSFPIWNFQIESLSLWGLKRKGISRKFGITWIDLRELRNYSFFFFFLILSDHELYHLTSKPISDEKDTFKSFMTFDIIPCMPVFIMVVESQIVVPPTSPPSQWHFMTRTHDLGFVIICQTISCVTLPQNQLMMRKTHSNFLWH